MFKAFEGYNTASDNNSLFIKVIWVYTVFN